MHPYALEAKASRSSRVKAMTGQTREQKGGMASADRAATRLVEPTRAEDGADAKEVGRASGAKASVRLDKRARGGRIKKPSTVVNVMIGKPGGDSDQPQAMPIPVPVGGLSAGPAMPPPGAAPMGGAPGPIPGMMARKHGGRIPHTGEAQNRTAKMRAAMGNKLGFAAGGRVHSYPKMDAGSASGEGRLEKVEKYGKKAR